MRIGRFVASACLAPVLFGGLSLLSGCGDEATQTGTLAPPMTPEDQKETEESVAAYRGAGKPEPKSKK